MTSLLPHFFKRQGWHAAALLLLVWIAWYSARATLGDGDWLGITDTAWFWMGVGIAIVHQVVVWLGWRAQLIWKLFSRLFGRYDLLIWGILFVPLLAARPVMVFGMAMADRSSLALPSWLAITLGLLLLIPSLYTMWSVARYFGIKRAMGGDHFRSKYREMPLVREGAFAWSSNAMYAFGFLGLWSIALLLESHAALCVALFQHAYIWVHQFCTESPDAEVLYGSAS